MKRYFSFLFFISFSLTAQVQTYLDQLQATYTTATGQVNGFADDCKFFAPSSCEGRSCSNVITVEILHHDRALVILPLNQKMRPIPQYNLAHLKIDYCDFPPTNLFLIRPQFRFHNALLFLLYFGGGRI